MAGKFIDALSLSSIRSYPSPETEDDIIGRIDAQQETKKLFASEQVSDRQKIIIALRYEIFPVELKGVRVRTKSGEKTLGQLATALPENGSMVTHEAIGKVLGTSVGRVQFIEDKGLDAGRAIVTPPASHRRLS